MNTRSKSLTNIVRNRQFLPYKFNLLIIWKYFLGRVYDIQGQKAIFLKKGFAEYSSVVVQFTKKINSIRDQIESNGGKAEATDVEIGQG